MGFICLFILCSSELFRLKTSQQRVQTEFLVSSGSSSSSATIHLISVPAGTISFLNELLYSPFAQVNISTKVKIEFLCELLAHLPFRTMSSTISSFGISFATMMFSMSLKFMLAFWRRYGYANSELISTTLAWLCCFVSMVMKHKPERHCSNAFRACASSSPGNARFASSTRMHVAFPVYLSIHTMFK